MLKQILKYVIPSILTSMLTGIYVIVDGFFIGNKIGDLGLAAINIAWPVTAFIQTLGIAIGTASGIHYSIARGQRDENKQKNIISNMLFIIIVFSIICSLILTFKNPLLRTLGANDETLSYAGDYLKVIVIGSFIEIYGCALTPLLRNLGYIKVASAALIAATIGNFIGDYVFIYAFDLKLFGAALSSLLAQGVAMLVCFITLLKTKKFYINKKINLKLIKDIIITSIAPFILLFSASVLLIINNKLSFKYGGNEGVAAYTVFCYVLYIAQYAAQGVSDGVQPILSLYYGKKDYLSLKKVLKISLIIMTIFLAVITIICIPLRAQFGNFFGISDGAKSIYNNGYYIFVAGFIFLALIRIVSCYLYATNKTVPANILVILEPFIITPILLLIFPRFIGIEGIWLSYLICQIILFLISLVMYIINRKKIEGNI